MTDKDQPQEFAVINELLGIMNEHQLDAIKVKVGTQTYELIKREPGQGPAASVPSPPGAGSAGATPPTAGAVAGPGVKKVTAPLVGVFYPASAPGAEPFVSIGDRVQEGQTLCILEAMKLMNEITSDYSGILTRIIPESGELVSLGEEMFWIE